MSHFTVGVIVPNFVALEYQDHPEKFDEIPALAFER